MKIGLKKHYWLLLFIVFFLVSYLFYRYEYSHISITESDIPTKNAVKKSESNEIKVEYEILLIEKEMENVINKSEKSRAKAMELLDQAKRLRDES